MNAADVVGYVWSGEIYCEDCGHPDLDDPVFPGMEVDSPCTCSDCHDLIPGQVLSADGQRELLRRKAAGQDISYAEELIDLKALERAYGQECPHPGQKWVDCYGDIVTIVSPLVGWRQASEFRVELADKTLDIRREHLCARIS